MESTIYYSAKYNQLFVRTGTWLFITWESADWYKKLKNIPSDLELIGPL